MRQPNHMSGGLCFASVHLDQMQAHETHSEPFMQQHPLRSQRYVCNDLQHLQCYYHHG